MRTRAQRLCVVTPCFNEAEVLPLFYEAVRDVLRSIADLEYRLIFVDDGSHDGTLAVLNQLAVQDPCVRAYSLSRNFGHQVALSAGLDAARGDAIVLMDCDLQHPPALIPQFVELWRQGNDIVSAVREDTADASCWKRWTSTGFYWLMNRISDTRVVCGAADFCLLSRRAQEALQQMPERDRFLRGMVSWIGFRRAFVPFRAPARAAGHSKYDLRRMLNLATAATLSLSTAPLRWATRVGSACILAAIAWLAILAVTLTGPGWPWAAALGVALQGLQMVFLGIVGEYVGRTFHQVRARPLYLLKQSPCKGARRLSVNRPDDDRRRAA
jgi:glycosyltransferase involved in cell wall biosynthesis